MANAPHPPRDKRSYAGDLRCVLSGIFLREGLDRLFVICPTSETVAQPTAALSSVSNSAQCYGAKR
jgi:hypothetical protein